MARRSASCSCCCCRCDFPYPLFALVLALNGVSMGLFASPNRAGVMNSLPRGDRGAGGGMNQTFQNSAQVLSVGVFFTLLIAGLSSTLPGAVTSGLEAHGVAAAAAQRVAHLPPVSILFAAFLGYNPMQHFLGGHALAALGVHDRALLTGRSFFPALISAPFRTGLHEAFVFAIVACLGARAARHRVALPADRGRERGPGARHARARREAGRAPRRLRAGGAARCTGARDRRVDLLFVPVGGGATIGAEDAGRIAERLKPRWVVPMHYRTPRVGFLETAEAFLARKPSAHRLDAPAFDTEELPAAGGALAVVPAAP